MTLERIVDTLGSFVGKHLVSRREEIKRSGPFKGVKTYRIELWDVEALEIIMSVEKTEVINSETKDKIVEELEYILLNKMFDRYVK